MKKTVPAIVTSLLLLALVSGSLFAGGGRQQSSTAVPGEISGNLEFWGPDGAGANPNDPGNIWWRETITAFRAKYPRLNMQISSTPGTANEYLVKLTTELAAGRSPDVMQTWLTGRLQPFVEAGRVRPLNAFVDARPELKEILSPLALSYATFGNSYYAIPMLKSCEIIFYNKRIFSENGLSIPKTYDEFMALCANLKNRGIQPVVTGNADVWPGAMPYMMLFNRMHGNDLYQQVVVQHQAKFDDPAFAETGKKLQEMFAAGVFNSNVNSTKYDEAQSRFISGEAAMIFDGEWAASGFLDRMKDEFGVFPFPDVPGGKGSSNDWLLNYNDGMAISTDSKNLPAAEAWLEFIFSVERQVDYASRSKLVATVNLPIDYSKLPPVIVELNNGMDNAANAYNAWDNPLGAVMGNEFNLAVQRCFAGEDPVRVFQDLNRIARMEWQ
jgi:raffinose/stachyose/melibiose transport system substrate-binding protein